MSFPPDDIRDWLLQLDSRVFVIDRLIQLRDRYIAHSESSTLNKNKEHIHHLNLTLDEFADLISLTEDIIRAIHFITFGIIIDDRTPTFDRNKFSILAKE